MAPVAVPRAASLVEPPRWSAAATRRNRARSRSRTSALFLDELPEFDRHVLEMLREPLEAGRITISRAAQQADFPAACQLIAAMNPCPCGWHGDPSGRCRCSPDVAARYLRKLSGPLVDRIDIQIDLPALSPAELATRASAPGEPSAAVAARVAQARALQLDRQGKTNHMLSGRETDDLCRPTDEGERLLREAGERFGWSARAYFRVLKVARTIADRRPAADGRADRRSDPIPARTDGALNALGGQNPAVKT